MTAPVAAYRRERLQALMLFRVILVTVFLGAALLLDVNALADFSDPTNTTMLLLIVGTYALTILYAVMLRTQSNVFELAVAQLTLDVIIVGVLVNASGGVDSPFLFLFLLFVVAGALVLGRRAALNVALAVTAMMFVLAADTLALFEAEPASGLVWKETLFRVGLNGSAAIIIALLSGYLTELLGEATTRIEEQQASLDRLRALNDNILASLTSGLMTVDADDRIIFFNLAAEQILSAPAPNVLQQPLAEVFPPLAAITANDSRQRGELRYERDDGSAVYLGFSVSPLVADEEQSGRIIIFQDLSEIKRLEDEVQRSERLAAIGALAAGIAHEIRNPLAAISGSVEMLADEGLSPDDQHLLQIVLREVDRLNGLITDFLEYSRPRPLNLVRASLHAEVRRATDLFERRADIQLETALQDDVDVMLDTEAFQQVIWNLLNNAAQAASSTATNPRVRLRVHGTTLWVEDNGPGIAREHIDKIYQPFFTTRGEGTGLGLATLYKLIEAHEAQITTHAHGALGGATFELQLRAADG